MATVPLHQGQEAVLAAADAEREEAGAKEARDDGRGGGGRQELQTRLQVWPTVIAASVRQFIFIVQRPVYNILAEVENKVYY